VRLHRAGRFTEAESAYEGFLGRVPGSAEGWNGFGILAVQSGRAEEACRRFARGVSLAPENVEILTNLGSAYEAVGELEPARAAYRRALALEPDDSTTLFNLGVVSLALGEPEAAVWALQRAAERSPRDAEIRLNLSRAHAKLGNAAGARAEVDRARELVAGDTRSGDDVPRAAIFAQQGELEQQAGRYEQALAHYEAARNAGSTSPGVLGNLGLVNEALGRPERAEQCYRRALRMKPGWYDAELYLARLLDRLGRNEEAFRHGRRALGSRPDSPVANALLVRLSRRTYPTRWDPEFFGWLRRWWGGGGAETEDLARASARQIAAHPIDIAARLAGGRSGAELRDGGPLRPVLLPFLEQGLNTDAELEQILIRWRRHLLDSLEGGALLDGRTTDLLLAFAQQAFNNEYVWPVSSREDSLVARRLQALESSSSLRCSPSDLRSLLVAVLYADPGRHSGLARRLRAARDLGPAYERYARRTLDEPERERHLAEGVRRLGPVLDEVSGAVRAQYESNPYPRWMMSPGTAPVPLRDYLARQFPGQDFERLARPFRALVAGCGTGQEPLRLARSCPGSRVVALDLSLTSLGYGLRLQSESHVENVEFVHGDILDLGDLGDAGTFDVIISNGVLHHMADPVAGWRALRRVLAPQGLMKIGLYSRAARAVVGRLRSRIEEERIACTPSGIRSLRARLMSGRMPDYAALLASEDLYSMSGCRDLLFHVCEHHFTLPEIAGIVARLRLDLVGFELPAGRCAGEPGDGAPEAGAAGFGRWHAEEQREPGLFAGMYQFWLRAS